MIFYKIKLSAHWLLFERFFFNYIHCFYMKTFTRVIPSFSVVKEGVSLL